MSAAAPSIRAAIVGAGLMGRWHAHAIRHAGGRVVAVADSDLVRAAQLAGQLREKPVVENDIGYLLSRHRIDVLHVCTPVESHEEVTSAALSAGVHVLVEKPLAADCGTVERLHARAAEQGLLLCPVHQFLFQPGILSASHWLNELGAVRHFELVACSAGAKLGSSEEGEQVARDILPHGLALARRLLGTGWLDAGWYIAPGGAGEIRASTFSGPTSLSIMVSMSARPTENSLTIRCDGGTIRANLYHGYAVLERGHVSRLDKLARPFAGAALVLSAATSNLARRAVRAEAAYSGLRELVTRFYGATTGACESPISAAESIDVARARDGLIGARVIAQAATAVTGGGEPGSGADAAGAPPDGEERVPHFMQHARRQGARHLDDHPASDVQSMLALAEPASGDAPVHQLCALHATPWLLSTIGAPPGASVGAILTIAELGLSFADGAGATPSLFFRGPV